MLFLRLPQNLVKNFIDVADNLERAAGAVPLDELNGEKEVDAARALSLLRSLRDGVLMTDTILMKVLACWCFALCLLSSVHID